ncbi:hypothetical protein COCON_G00191680 [Conger conger]|uniref:Uncharacterized protein n=1 Tax=Conger conger TaxID=82655 RepID=A0A9Q1D393_CONCO|nr:hypothetical protein COCON_G00191680 [Conger conger]
MLSSEAARVRRFWHALRGLRERSPASPGRQPSRCPAPPGSGAASSFPRVLKTPAGSKAWGIFQQKGFLESPDVSGKLWKPLVNGRLPGGEYDVLPPRQPSPPPLPPPASALSQRLHGSLAEGERGHRGGADRGEDEYQVPSSHPATANNSHQPLPCVSAQSTPSRERLGNGHCVHMSPERPADRKKHKAFEHEDLFGTLPRHEPAPPPPPSRHSFVEVSSSSPASCTRARRPASGHDPVPFSPEFFDLLSGAGAPAAVWRQEGDSSKSAARVSQEYNHLPPTAVLADGLQAPARPPKPPPRNTPPEVHHRRHHGKTPSGHSADAKIAKLMGEGYSFEDVKRALMIAQNKVDVARNILREFALVAPRLNL